MEVIEVTCNKCRAILEFYKHDIAVIVGVASSEVNVDAIIKRHTLKPDHIWELKSPRSGSALQKSAYQCHADPDHHWTINHVEPTAGNVKEIGA